MDATQQTVSEGEVTVTKHLDSTRFDTPAVILDITSAADRNTSVTVAEPVPEAFPSKNIGFHPEFGGEHWSVSEDQIVFNRTIEPEGEYTTVYGLRNVTEEDISKFLDGETVVSTGDGIGTTLEDTTRGNTDGGPIEGLLAERDDETVRQMIAGEVDSVVESPDGGREKSIQAENPKETPAPEPQDGDEDTGKDTAPEDVETENVGGDAEFENVDGVTDKDAEFEDVDEDTEGTEKTEYTHLETGGMEEDTESEGVDADTEDGENAGYVDTESEDTAKDAGDVTPTDVAQDAEDIGYVDVQTEDLGDIGGSEVEYVSVDPETPDSEDIDPDETTDEYGELPNSVAEALAGEIRDGSITEENERILREAFSDSPRTRRDVDVRIKRLQTVVADLAAYIDEFERLIEGESDSLLRSFEATLSEVTDRVESLENSVDTMNERLAEVETELEAARDDPDRVEPRSEEIDVLRNQIERIQMEIEDVLYLEEDLMELNDRVDAVQELSETVEKLDAEMEEMKSFRERLSKAFGPTGDRVETGDE